MAAGGPLSQEELSTLLEALSRRWLTAPELLRLLYNFKAAGIPVLQAVVRRPPSGSFFLYDSTLRVRDDGYAYCKKLHSTAAKAWEIRESYVKMAVRGVPRLSCATSEIEGRPSFRRRIYRLLDSEFVPGSDNAARGLNLVHYLDTDSGATDGVILPSVASSTNLCPFCKQAMPTAQQDPATRAQVQMLTAPVATSRAAPANVTSEPFCPDGKAALSPPINTCAAALSTGTPDHAAALLPGLSSSSGEDDIMHVSDDLLPGGLHIDKAFVLPVGSSVPFDEWDLGPLLSAPTLDSRGHGDVAAPISARELSGPSLHQGPGTVMQSDISNSAAFLTDHGATSSSFVLHAGRAHSQHSPDVCDNEDWASGTSSHSDEGELQRPEQDVLDASDDECVGQGGVEGRTNRLLQRLMAQMSTLAAAVGEDAQSMPPEPLGSHAPCATVIMGSTGNGSTTTGRRSRRRLDASLSQDRGAEPRNGSMPRNYNSEGGVGAPRHHGVGDGWFHAPSALPATQRQQLAGWPLATTSGALQPRRNRGPASLRSTSSALDASRVGDSDAAASLLSEADCTASWDRSTNVRAKHPQQPLTEAQTTLSAAVSAVDSGTGETLLHLAAKAGSADLVAALLHSGADGSVVDALGRTPLDCAVHALEGTDSSGDGFEACISLLRPRGISPTAQSKASGLHYSSMPRQPGVGDTAHNLSATDRRMLVDAFTALSLRDKCAVSIALGATPSAMPPASTVGGVLSATVAALPPTAPIVSYVPSVSQPHAGASSSAPRAVRDQTMPARHKREGHASLTPDHKATKINPALRLGDEFVLATPHLHASVPQGASHGHRLDDDARSETKRKRVHSDDESLPLDDGSAAPSALPGAAGGGINVLSSETQSVAHALALMSAEEVLDCKAEALRIQANVRSWLVRRHFRQLRDATRTVQAAIRRTLARRRVVGADTGGGASGDPLQPTAAPPPLGDLGGLPQASSSPGPPATPQLRPGGSLRDLHLPVIPEEGRVGSGKQPPLGAASSSSGSFLIVGGAEPPLEGPGGRRGSSEPLGASSSVLPPPLPPPPVPGPGAPSPSHDTMTSGLAAALGTPRPPPLDGSATASALRSLLRSRRQAEAAAVIARSLRRWVAEERLGH